MKKWKSGILMFMVALIMAGCSRAEEPDTKAEPEHPDYYVSVETDNAPYYSVDENGTASGFYVDLMNTLSERGGFTYEFQAMNATEYRVAGANITDGNTDAASTDTTDGNTDADSTDAISGNTDGSGATEQSGHLFLGILEPEVGDTSTFAQSEPVYATGLCLLVKKDQGIRKTKHLRSVSIAARAETEEAVFADYLAASYDAETIVFQDAANVLSDVSQGYSGAMVLDQGNASLALQQDGTLELLTTSQRYFSVHRFTATAAEGIPEELASALEELRADGTLDTLLQQHGLGA